jgi:hypothetical protein
LAVGFYVNIQFQSKKKGPMKSCKRGFLWTDRDPSPLCRDAQSSKSVACGNKKDSRRNGSVGADYKENLADHEI